MGITLSTDVMVNAAIEAGLIRGAPRGGYRIDHPTFVGPRFAVYGDRWNLKGLLRQLDNTLDVMPGGEELKDVLHHPQEIRLNGASGYAWLDVPLKD